MKKHGLKKMLPVILIFISAIALSGAQTSPLPKTIKYDLDITIDYATDKLPAICEIVVENNSDQR